MSSARLSTADSGEVLGKSLSDPGRRLSPHPRDPEPPQTITTTPGTTTAAAAEVEATIAAAADPPSTSTSTTNTDDIGANQPSRGSVGGTTANTAPNEKSPGTEVGKATANGDGGPTPPDDGIQSKEAGREAVEGLSNSALLERRFGVSGDFLIDRRSEPTEADHAEILAKFQNGLGNLERVVLFDIETSHSDEAVVPQTPSILGACYQHLSEACVALCDCHMEEACLDVLRCFHVR